MQEDMSRLLENYQKKIIPALKEEFGERNIMAVPRVEKVIVSVGLKEAAHDEGVLNNASTQLAVITGQKPAVRRARKSIAAFKLVRGNPIGLMVTLRGARMYDFLDKLLSVVLPRIRDFRGVPTKSFDRRGNYSLGLSEQTIFPEVEFSKAEKSKGLEVTIVTNTDDDVKARRLLELLGFPFKKE